MTDPCCAPVPPQTGTGPRPPRVLIRNIGELFTGDIAEPRLGATSILIEDGLISAFDADDAAADLSFDARGTAVLPGLVDGHVHPVLGEWTPVQNAQDWITHYLHGGTTTMVSAGELHLPGLDPARLTADLATAIVEVTAGTGTGRYPCGAVLHTGTLLLVPGITERHLDRALAAGTRLAKFLFHPLHTADLLAQGRRLVEQCAERGIRTKLHTGGVSRSGRSAPVDASTALALGPDVAAHISGGPIPMTDADITRLVAEAPFHLELCSSGNDRAGRLLVDALAEAGRLDRLVVGTDTPGGTGVIPRGMLRNLAFLTGVCGLPVEIAVACVTGNTAAAHGLDVGILAVGRPADLLVAGAIRGSASDTFSGSLGQGDLPGLSLVMSGGVPRLYPRTDQVPPPLTTIALSTGR